MEALIECKDCKKGIVFRAREPYDAMRLGNREIKVFTTRHVCKPTPKGPFGRCQGCLSISECTQGRKINCERFAKYGWGAVTR
jgi:hypothetical protein